MSALCDTYQRAITYLRVSVTDRCNLRCVYCMPVEGVTPRTHAEILSYEEIARVVRVGVGLGITKVRVTGGEPLARKGIVELVRILAAIAGIQDLSMTTNGILLVSYADALAQSGLQRVNVSLDTLSPERYHTITRWGQLEDALNGIEAAQRAGLRPIKINMVPIRGVNDDEVVEFARRTITHGWHVRFIELMPIGEGAHLPGQAVVSSAEIRERILAEIGPLQPATLEGNGPARYARLPGAEGTLGFISALTEHFCPSCNRLRLSADGRLMPCLFSSSEVDLRATLRAGGDDEGLRALFLRSLAIKPDRHHLAEQCVPIDRAMSRVGG